MQFLFLRDLNLSGKQLSLMILFFYFSLFPHFSFNFLFYPLLISSLSFSPPHSQPYILDTHWPQENSHVSNMSPFSRDLMNKSGAKTRAGKIITLPLAQSAYLSLLIALMLFTSFHLLCVHTHINTHTHSNSCIHMLIFAQKHISWTQMRIYMLIQTCLGCFLPLPRST